MLLQVLSVKRTDMNVTMEFKCDVGISVACHFSPEK